MSGPQAAEHGRDGADPVAPGLHLVSTPIGSARDITLRALDVLAAADVLAAEDTRSLRRLMQMHGIKLGDRPLVAYHEHSSPQARERLLSALADGKSVAYASEAGTPLIADPGYRLAADAVAAGHRVTAAPGPCAAITGISIAGLATDRFLFAGFPPQAKGARASWLDEIGSVPATLVFYESPKRIARFLGELAERWGDRQAALARELTKRFEEVRRGTLSELAEGCETDPPRGEIVLVVARGEDAGQAEDLEAALDDALERLSVKDAAAEVAERLKLPKREVYQAALRRR